MDIYLDASAIVALVAREPNSQTVTNWLQTHDGQILVSDFAMAEASTALARRRRIGAASAEETEAAYVHLDGWVGTYADAATIAEEDVAVATLWVRQHDLGLRAPDAIHIAAADRLDTTLLTLDQGMARAAHALGVACINPAATAV